MTTAITPPWAEIDTVMFDMDGTLLDLHFDNYFWQDHIPLVYSRSQGISHAAAIEEVASRCAEVHGTLDWYCLDFWASSLQLDINALKRELSHKIRIRPNVIALLSALKQARKRLLLITNAHPDSLSLKLAHTNIGEHFDHTISSHRLRLAKENHGFWKALRQLEPYDPERSLLIDDSIPVLRQAAREGIRHLYAIHQPDSRQAPLTALEFPQIRDFEHIIPAVTPCAGQSGLVRHSEEQLP
ncbi:MAG: GMP/IMP nucleotidase [Pseudohongiellaceae bacterium]